MTDADLEADLATAFLTPVTPERPELAAAVMKRVRRADRHRRAVILGSGLVGAGLATAAVAVLGVLDAASLRAAADLAYDPNVALGLGLALIALAVTRHALSDA